MPHGLQVFDDAGRLVLDITSRAARITAAFETGLADGSINIPSLGLGGEPFFFVEDNSADINMSSLYAYPNVAISGTTVSWGFVDWTFQGAVVPRRSVVIRVGTF